MQKIYFINTVHEDIGKCNGDELHKILSKLSPEVVFLEALESNYSEYDQIKFSDFGVFHKRLEIKAIQKYSLERTFNYIAVLDFGHSEEFEEKYELVCKNNSHQRLLDYFNSLAANLGFSFLNSTQAIKLQDELRKLEEQIFNNPEEQKKVEDYIDNYENNMVENIYSFCRENHFDKAVFMCGVAHRKSMLQKITEYEESTNLKLDWEFPTEF